MLAMSFTRDRGFFDVEVSPDWADGEDFNQWLAKAGFEAHAGQKDLSVADGDSGLSIYRATTNKEWYAVADLEDPIQSSGPIFVASAAELMNLRLALQPMHVLTAAARLDEFVTMAEKAFCAWHGHPFTTACDKCDPGQMARVRARKALKGNDKT